MALASDTRKRSYKVGAVTRRGRMSHAAHASQFEKTASSDKSGEKQEGNGPLDEHATMFVISDSIFDLVFKISNLNSQVSMCMLPLKGILVCL